MKRHNHFAFFAFILGCLVLLPMGCSSEQKSSSVSSVSDTPEERAESAVEKTGLDERFASKIQREMNGLFFHGKKTNPEGLDAFSETRMSELEEQMKESKSDAIQYFLLNRKYFERTEDSGGGFRIVTNGKRLMPYLKTRAGRRKLFQMDLVRVREMIANPCFSAIEDCGEDASDGEENTALLEEWTGKYSDREFQMAREKLLRSYLAALGEYETRIARKAFKIERRKKETVLLLGMHRRRVEALLRAD